MESFWDWFKEDIKTPGTILVLGFFAFLLISGIFAWARGRDQNPRYLWQEIVMIVGSWFR